MDLLSTPFAERTKRRTFTQHKSTFIDMAPLQLLFVTHTPTISFRTTRHSINRHVYRRGLPRTSSAARSITPCIQMLAKFQKKKDQQSSSRPEDERPLDQILPPPLLPTLSTLTGTTPTSTNDEQSEAADSFTVTNPSSYTDIIKDDPEQDILPKDTQLAQMGLGLSELQENSVIQFFKEIWVEFQTIEWTPFSRVVRLTILVIVIIFVATSSLYVVDGFLSRVAKLAFDENI